MESAAISKADAEAMASVGAATRELIARRHRASIPMRRGWMIRRALLLADLFGLTLAFVVAGLLLGSGGPGDRIGKLDELLLFVASLPIWIVLAKLHGLYDRDDERTGHSTVDDLVGVLSVVTFGTWVFLIGAHVTNLAGPRLPMLGLFWFLAVACVTATRAVVRGYCQRRDWYVQNTLIVGTGEIGQLLARKLTKHREYGITVVGFVDRDPLERWPDLAHIPVLGPPERLVNLVRLLDVERVIFAYSKEPNETTVESIRSLRDLDVQIDLVPRLFDIFSPAVGIHTIETFPLVGLPPVRLSPSSTVLKRGLDIVGATIGLILSAPLFAIAALLIKLDSPGPVFFRQSRLGLEQREFVALKFRTMRVDTDDAEHRRYIAETMNAPAGAGAEANGLYKLDRGADVTRVGHWLRKTSIDELPQLVNVLRGEMSLVGPRPCLAYETEHFQPHHFERFLVPPGLTGLWQVSARANSSFAEALEIDVAYARGWSLGLDLRLLFRTPVEVFRQRRATA
jgi:exopolysaccharide biosynthesis polyprenyl glycosylphosphotransferase